MLSFSKVVVSPFLKDFSWELEKGGAAFVVESEFERRWFLRVITGFIKPFSGCIRLIDKDISLLSSSEIYSLRKKIGVVMSDGGLLSNLKIWENILLPLLYHGKVDEKSAKESLVDFLKMFDISLNLYSLPGFLEVYERRLAALIRAFIMNPKFLVYEGIFDGLGYNIKQKFIEIVRRFHKDLKKDYYIFLTCDASFLESFGIKEVVRFGDGTFYKRD